MPTRVSLAMVLTNNEDVNRLDMLHVTNDNHQILWECYTKVAHGTGCQNKAEYQKLKRDNNQNINRSSWKEADEMNEVQKDD